MKDQATLESFAPPPGVRRSGSKEVLTRPGGSEVTGAILVGVRPIAVSWNGEVEAFLEAKVAETPVGENWIRRMRWELARVPEILRRIDSSLVPVHVRDVTSEQVLAIRKTMKWEKATFVVHFAALRQFLRWAGNPVGQRMGVWRLPAGQPSRRRWLTKAQFERLYTAAEGPAKLLTALEGLNGLRRVEVLRLRKKDVLFDEGCLRVLGKGRDGGKWRNIPMHPIVQAMLGDQIRRLRAEDRLFALSRSGADQMLQRAARRAGFPREGTKVSHHDLRRTFGRLAHEAGMDLVQIKNLLGHSSVDMTVHYIGLDSKRMREGLELVRLLP